jgi:hypothetical protein
MQCTRDRSDLLDTGNLGVLYGLYQPRNNQWRTQWSGLCFR